MFLVSPEQIEPPAGLGGYALFAWNAAVASLGERSVAQAELLTLEAACRAWARWKALEEKIAELSRVNVLAGELSKSASGSLQTSALRSAADAALVEWKQTAGGFGIAMPDSRTEVPHTDLFGYPDRPGRGERGRPAYRPNLRDRNRVRLLLAMGWSNPRIASALEISLPTLHRYFKVELKERAAMRDRLDARRFEIAMEQANVGNVTALKELGKMIEANDRMEIERDMATQPKGDGAKPPERLGKKIVDAQKAMDADADLMAELEREAATSTHQ
jgi:putative ubiquitin-RnfH superfamily antitoxin RatB of RatAB toxin-antitoxin module